MSKKSFTLLCRVKLSLATILISSVTFAQELESPLGWQSTGSGGGNSAGASGASTVNSDGGFISQTGETIGNAANTTNDVVRDHQEKWYNAITRGKGKLETRYRYEQVSEEGKPEDATAHTLRTRLSYETGAVKGVSAMVEFEHNQAIGGNDDYYDGVSGDSSTYPTIADPQNTEVNQAYIRVRAIPDTDIKIGRQVVKIGNERFVGAVDWRQNQQTYDAATIVNKSIKDTTLLYGYVDKTHTPLGNDASNGNLDMSTHLFYAHYNGLESIKPSAYAYLMDFEDVPELSSASYGVRLEAHHKIRDNAKIFANLEYATQSDYADNPTSYDANYYVIEPGVKWRSAKLYAGWEVLGSDDGMAAFQFPAGTNHKFNGWADIFLSTPADGLDDKYIAFSYETPKTAGDFFKNVKFHAAWHTYESDNDSIDYGDEINVKLTKKFWDHYSFGVAYADYNADEYSHDKEKLAVWLEGSFPFDASNGGFE